MVCCLVAGCGGAPVPVAKVDQDPTADPAYARNVAQLVSMYREASSLFESKKGDEAGAILTKAQPLMERLLGVSRPTLAAMEVVSDLDQLYGRMLLANHHYGWARLLFQKNLARWKHWVPHNDETERRWKLAADSIAECDRKISQ